MRMETGHGGPSHVVDDAAGGGVQLGRAAALAAALLIAPLAACQSSPSGNANVPEPAKAVELDRYLGRWYEIARYPQSFERGCQGVTADYALRRDGRISVVNTCREGRADGPARTAEGQAYVVEGSNGAKLKVSFFGPFYGNYWVLDRADDYAWAIVGEPSGRYLWILAREPVPENRDALVARTRELGYDVSMLEYPEQPPR